MSRNIVFGLKLEGETFSKWQSVKANTIGKIYVGEGTVGTSARFVEIANKMYNLDVPSDGAFSIAVCQLYDAIHAITKAKRAKLREKNAGSLGFDLKGKKYRVKEPKASRGHLVLAAKDGKRIQYASKDTKEAFYASWEWRTLRMEVIKKQGKRCNCCGATPEDLTVGGSRVRLVVDHIKPLSKHWNLRLEPSNLQVLCDECNMGKGAWDETDHRSESHKLIEEQLRYEVL